MQDAAYNEVLNRVHDWSLDDRLKLVEDIVASIRKQVDTKPRHSAREFRGIGRETWKDVDIDEYIRQERASWDD